MAWQSELLHWYRKNRRDLPWRRTRDPYAIWVSEIMLQQTTVEAVIPYYERFLKRFPTIDSLAKAGIDEVLSLWSGLGYYSRARNLHRAAKQITTVPDMIDELMKLPGIGRYTAGAIASIAFGKRAPILDGNVIRVLSRLFRIGADPKSSKGQKLFWKRAEEILPVKHCGDFNQSLMELGATVCLPENPLCPLCPVSPSCRARKTGDPRSYPLQKKKTIYRDLLITAAVIERQGKVLMVRRSDHGLLRGMWELPMVEGTVQDLVGKWPVGTLKVLRTLEPIRHSVLNARMVIYPLVASLKRRPLPAKESCWLRPEEMERFPTSSMNHKIIRSVMAAPPSGKGLRRAPS